MTTLGMKKSEMLLEATFEGTSEVICKAISEGTPEAISEGTSEAKLEVTSKAKSEAISKAKSEATSESNGFDRRVTLLIDCGVMKDKDWRNQDVKKRTKGFLKLWEKMQKGMTHTTSPISYVQLKEDRKGTREKVLSSHSKFIEAEIWA
jgi:hypothetical protein